MVLPIIYFILKSNEIVFLHDLLPNCRTYQTSGAKILTRTRLSATFLHYTHYALFDYFRVAPPSMQFTDHHMLDFNIYAFHT